MDRVAVGFLVCGILKWKNKPLQSLGLIAGELLMVVEVGVERYDRTFGGAIPPPEY